MNVQTRNRLLGLYLLLCASYQVGIYFFPQFFPSPSSFTDPTGYDRWHNTSWFDFANPRIWFLEYRFLQPLYWVSAIWLAVVAMWMLARPAKRLLLQVYVVGELGMAVYAVLYFLAYPFKFFISFSYSVSYDVQLQIKIAVFIAFSVVPCVVAVSFLPNAKLALRLFATFVLSVLARPAGLLLGLFVVALLSHTPIPNKALDPIWDGVGYVAKTLPFVVYVFGVRRSFREMKFSTEEMS